MSDRREWAEGKLEEENPDALFADGLDEAIVGIATRATQPPLVVYDEERILDIKMERDGMSWDEAREDLSYNIAGAWVGEGTPLILEPYPGEDDEGQAMPRLRPDR